MPRTIKFHLDDYVSPAVADGIRRRGMDVTTTIDAGLQGADDVDHIAFALPAGRVIVTHDDDYLALHAQGVRHAGIAYCHQHPRSVGQIISTLVLIWQVLEPAEMEGRVEYL
jgi:predicted nuclease of predicted toxin-antitoxin system